MPVMPSFKPLEDHDQTFTVEVKLVQMTGGRGDTEVNVMELKLWSLEIPCKFIQTSCSARIKKCNAAPSLQAQLISQLLLSTMKYSFMLHNILLSVKTTQ